ncbi:hypothetical protein, partial [Francisella tularensis]|uniref:hypothetical protein n=1 Tax=Francisella tularensis TaxID=263 RepID=UPI001CD29384
PTIYSFVNLLVSHKKIFYKLISNIFLTSSRYISCLSHSGKIAFLETLSTKESFFFIVII